MSADDVARAALMAAFIVLIGAALWAIASYRCEARWEQSGRRSEFRLFAGCLVQMEHGWVPDDRIREVNP